MTILGTAGNDLLVQGTAANDTIDGLAGADTMVGLSGDDYYILDNMGDVVTEGVGEGTDTIYFTGSFTPYTLADNVENFILDPGVTFLDFNDNALDNTIDGGGLNSFFIFGGGGGNDTISNAGFVFAGAGNDTINGFSNSSQLHGQAGDDLINGGDASEQITGGIGNDTAYGGGGNDNMWASDGVLEDGGNDAFFGGAGNDTIYGGMDATNANLNLATFDGNDTLEGGEGDDRLFGRTGNDTLNGGLGADTMISLTGNDIFFVDNIGDVVQNDGMGIDELRTTFTTDLNTFVGGADGFENLTLLGSADINGTGTMGNNTILGNSGTNTLIGGLGDDTYGVDSLSDVVTELAGEGTDTINASITYTLADNLENLTLTGMDTISGTGNAADNTITGNAAANTLTGGTGIDTLIGGAGNDIFNVDNIGDVVTEMMNEGIDTVNSSVTYTLGANVENLALQGTADISGTGNMLNNNLVGNTGANTLTGGLGDDVYDVDNAGDVVTELLGEGDDTVNSTITHTLGENIENLNLLGTSDLNGTGNTLNNTLEGNAGSNSLDGGVGNDTILANGGDDTVDGGAGNDALSGGSGLDVLNGGADNDTLFGNEGNDVLNGGLGDDTLNGGAGDDSINGGDGSDTAVFTASSTSVTVDVQNGALVIGSGQGTDTVGMDVEFLAFSDQTLSFTNTATLIGQNTGTSTPAIVMGTTAEQLRGFQLDYGSVLTSTARENANFGLTSLSSTRLLFEDVTLGYSLEFTGPGLGQSSSLTELNTAVSTGLSTGAFTNATLSGPLGNNQGNGTVMSLDTGTEFGGISVGASYTLSSGNQTFEVDGALPTSVEQFEGLGRAFAQLPDFETFGSTQQTTLTNELMTLGVNEVRMQSGFGTTFGYDISDDFAVSVSYAGAGGNDDLSGGGGTDTINGMDGNDTIRGFLGDDVLNGGEGNDRLLGAEGNDTLNGGDGADVLNGGDGDDFIFGGFSSADLRDVVFAGAGNDSIDAGYGNDEIFGQDGNDIIAGGFGSDTLQGQNGNDVLTGSALSDLVFGNEGDDFVNGGFGHDRINGGTGADRFFHLGILDHGSDFIQDYSTTEGDLLLFGQVGATRDQFQININDAVAPDGEKAGDDAIQEAFVIYRPTGQIMWALIDGAGQSSIDLRLGGETVSFGLGIDF